MTSGTWTAVVAIRGEHDKTSALVIAALFVGCNSAMAAPDVIPLKVIERQHKACVESCNKSSGGKTARSEKAWQLHRLGNREDAHATEYMNMNRAIAENPKA